MFDNLIMKAPRSLMFSKRIFHFSNLNILLKMLNTIICYFLKEELGEKVRGLQLYMTELFFTSFVY